MAIKTNQEVLEEFEKVLRNDCGNLEITHGTQVDGSYQPLLDFILKLRQEDREEANKRLDAMIHIVGSFVSTEDLEKIVKLLNSEEKV